MRAARSLTGQPAVYLTALESAATPACDPHRGLRRSSSSRRWQPSGAQNFGARCIGQVPRARRSPSRSNLRRCASDWTGSAKVGASLERLGLESSPPSILRCCSHRGDVAARGGEVYTTLADGGFVPGCGGARGARRARPALEVVQSTGRGGRAARRGLPARSDADARTDPRYRPRRAARLPPGLVVAGRREPHRIPATAGSQFHGNYLSVVWVATTTTAKPGSPALKARCRCGPTPWRASSRCPSIRSCRPVRIGGSDSTTDWKRIPRAGSDAVVIGSAQGQPLRSIPNAHPHPRHMPRRVTRSRNG